MIEYMKRNFRSFTVLCLVLVVGALAQPAHAQRLFDFPVLGAAKVVLPPPPPLQKWDFLCEYGSYFDIVFDGMSGQLSLQMPYYPLFEQKGTLTSGPNVYGVRYEILHNPQDFVDGEQGPGFRGTNSSRQHRIVFWVDFKKTPTNSSDDTKFDGYMMTSTKTAIAGVTWFGNVPYGFYAFNKQCVIG